MLFALCAAAFYALFNYLCGLYSGNAISGKVVQSFTGGLACLIIHLYQCWDLRRKAAKNRSNEGIEQSHAMNEYIKGVLHKEREKQMHGFDD